jgi:hypothetical protein
MNLNDAIDFCNKWLPSWSGNNPEALLEFYASDAFYLDPTVKNGLRGHGQMKIYFSKLLKNNPHWQWNHEEVFPTEKGFNLKWRAVIPVGDATMIEYGMDIVEMQNNKISRNEVFFDTHALLNAINSIKKQQ